VFHVALNEPVLVGIALAMAMPVHDTGTVWLTGAGRATEGWLGSLLHWRRMPMEFGSYPDPVTAIGVPPFRQVPGFAVSEGEPPDDVGAGLQGTVVVVVPPAVVVDVVVDDVVVVVVVFLALAAVAKVKTPASPATTAMDPMSPTRTSFLKRRILTPRAFRRPLSDPLPQREPRMGLPVAGSLPL
jgi:hypothetical protein